MSLDDERCGAPFHGRVGRPQDLWRTRHEVLGALLNRVVLPGTQDQISGPHSRPPCHLGKWLPHPQGPRAVPTSPSVPHSQGRPVAHPVDCPHEGRLKPVPPSSATAVLPAGLPASAPNPNTPSSPQQPEGSVRARSDPGSPCFEPSMASRGTENQTRVPPPVLQDSPPLPDATVPVTPPQAQWPVPPPPPQRAPSRPQARARAAPAAWPAVPGPAPQLNGPFSERPSPPPTGGDPSPPALDASSRPHSQRAYARASSPSGVSLLVPGPSCPRQGVGRRGQDPQAGRDARHTARAP